MDQFTLECFLAVASQKNFTRASKTVNRTQSAITQQINTLEKQLGIKLFNREKGVSLTQDGEVFLPYAKKIFSLYQEVIDRFKSPEVEGEVHFGVPEDFATVYLSDVLTKFSLLHPRIYLSVDCDFTLNLYKKFKAGLLDLVLLKMCSSRDFPNGVEVWQEPLVWVCKENTYLEYDSNQSLPLVIAPSPCVYRSNVIDALENSSIKWRIVYSSPSYAGILAAVKADMGITALPLAMIPPGFQKVRHMKLPILPDIHVSLLKNTEKSSKAIEAMEHFLLKNSSYTLKR